MHRVSYWKTTGIALAGVVLTLSALLWLNSASGHRAVLAASTFLSALLLIASVFIAAGGLVCLWRDAREVSGTPDMFAPLANGRLRADCCPESGLGFRGVHGSALGTSSASDLGVRSRRHLMRPELSTDCLLWPR